MIGRRTFLTGTAAAVSGYAFWSAVPAPLTDTGVVTLSGPTMGTYFRILVPERGDGIEPLRSKAVDVLAEVDRLMSTYKPDSEVSRLNAASPRSPVRLSAPTRAVIGEAQRIGKLTGGAFDATVGPLVEVWGFGASGRSPNIPDPDDIETALGQMGMDALHASEGTAWKARSGLAIDLSGVAKGYAVDRLAAMLDAWGLPAYLVDVGGELRAKGRRPDGQPWRVGIERPSPGHRSVYRTIALEDHSIATSGDYRSFFVQDGQSYAHVIDPRTARPITHSLASVTVLHRAAMTADALSTALMVMGPEEGLDFAWRHGIAAFFVLRDGDRLIDRHTPSLAPWIVATA